MRRYGWLWLSALLMLAYVGMIVWSKYQKVLGLPPVKLGEVGEFLLFFAAMLAFTLQVITADQRSGHKASAPDGSERG
jgi:hypothetical protein